MFSRAIFSVKGLFSNALSWDMKSTEWNLVSVLETRGCCSPRLFVWLGLWWCNISAQKCIYFIMSMFSLFSLQGTYLLDMLMVVLVSLQNMEASPLFFSWSWLAVELLTFFSTVHSFQESIILHIFLLRLIPFVTVFLPFFVLHSSINNSYRHWRNVSRPFWMERHKS